MFEHSGLSIAMGNADPEVKQAAHRTTQSNEDEGFAFAVEHFVLPAAKRLRTSGGSFNGRRTTRGSGCIAGVGGSTQG